MFGIFMIVSIAVLACSIYDDLKKEGLTNKITE